ncbi:MAG: hypothetical protein WAM14_10900, partial [Candidatus Nitrosopolaris sp.]
QAIVPTTSCLLLLLVPLSTSIYQEAMNVSITTILQSFYITASYSRYISTARYYKYSYLNVCNVDMRVWLIMWQR